MYFHDLIILIEASSEMRDLTTPETKTQIAFRCIRATSSPTISSARWRCAMPPRPWCGRRPGCPSVPPHRHLQSRCCGRASTMQGALPSDGLRIKLATRGWASGWLPDSGERHGGHCGKHHAVTCSAFGKWRAGAAARGGGGERWPAGTLTGSRGCDPSESPPVARNGLVSVRRQNIVRLHD